VVVYKITHTPSGFFPGGIPAFGSRGHSLPPLTCSTGTFPVEVQPPLLRGIGSSTVFWARTIFPFGSLVSRGVLGLQQRSLESLFPSLGVVRRVVGIPFSMDHWFAPVSQTAVSSIFPGLPKGLVADIRFFFPFARATIFLLYDQRILRQDGRVQLSRLPLQRLAWL